MKAKTKWILTYTVIGLAQILALTFPIAFQLRFLGKFNPLWIVLDDTRKNKDGTLAEDYRIYLRDYNWQWLGVLTWHVGRNRVWNLVELFGVSGGVPVNGGNQNIRITKMIHDELTNGRGQKIRQDGVWVANCALKYVGESGDDPYQVNRGDFLSVTHSIIGVGEIEYVTNDGFKGWRYSSCRLKKVWYWFGKEFWVTKAFGYGSSRPTFKIKHQKPVEWKVWKP